ncbi:MAG: N-acetyl sugar amidotransferase [Vampirovibrionales bacterium]
MSSVSCSMEDGTPLLQDIQYCIRCCMPETQEGITFDAMGVCQACRSSEQKMRINWHEREEVLHRILTEAKQKGENTQNYDCIVPISGGKDSFFQLHILVKVYGLKVLAVTFSHNWFSETGKRNLTLALETFDVDHIMYTPNRKLVNTLARKSLEAIGDSCWHCHAGVGAFSLHMAQKLGIPLLIWGESIAESSGRASYDAPIHTFDRDYFQKVSAKVPASVMVDHETVHPRDVLFFDPPSPEACEDAGVWGIHLGDYLFWDEERQTEFIKRAYGWEETDMEGTYKCYKSAECTMAGVHDFTCYLKRGYGRGTFHASMDVRQGLLSRQEGFTLAKTHDTKRPKALDYYLSITGMTEETFLQTMAKKRHPLLRDTPLPIDARD